MTGDRAGPTPTPAASGRRRRPVSREPDVTSVGTGRRRPGARWSSSAPAGSGTGAAPKLVSTVSSPLRKASTSSPEDSHSSVPRPEPVLAAQPQRRPVQLVRRAGHAALAVQRVLGPRPPAAAASSRRSGRSRTTGRRPPTGSAPGSRPGRAGCARCAPRSGPAGPRRAAWCARAGPAPRPGRGRPSRAAPASAGWPPGPGAGRARRPAAGRRRRCRAAGRCRPGRPSREACRTTSWLDSTQVVGAPTASVASSERVITAYWAGGRPGGAAGTRS